jgi:hypothetical protein
METWNFKNKDVNDEYLQNTWNHTLITKLNEINKSIINENTIISASYVLKDLLESIIWLNKPTINYRYDNKHSIYINNIELHIEGYIFDHQKDEEWIESQKNIFLNLETIPSYITYPEIWKTKNTLRNYLKNKYTSGKIINDDDIIYTGILMNQLNNSGNLIHFHVDELKSNKAIYKYDLKNNENKSLHPYLTLINDYLKHREVVQSYFTKEPMKLSEVKTFLNKLPEDYVLVSVEEVLHSNSLSRLSPSPTSTYLPIIKISIDEERKEILFYTKSGTSLE